MVEFTLVVPLLALITGLTFFFGWAFMHKHQVVVADRYAVWQRVENRAWPTEEKLNRAFFADKAVDVALGERGLSRQTAQDLVDEAGDRHQPAELLADELLMERFPGGHRAGVAAEFTSKRNLWRKYADSHIRSDHAREGITWRRDEVRCWTTLRDQYYADLDDSLKGLQESDSPGRNMAGMIRGLYLTHW